MIQPDGRTVSNLLFFLSLSRSAWRFFCLFAPFYSQLAFVVQIFGLQKMTKDFGEKRKVALVQKNYGGETWFVEGTEVWNNIQTSTWLWRDPKNFRPRVEYHVLGKKKQESLKRRIQKEGRSFYNMCICNESRIILRSK